MSFGLYCLYLSGLNRGSVSTLNLGKSLYPVPIYTVVPLGASFSTNLKTLKLTNPKYFIGLSGAQIISIIIILTSLFLFYNFNKLSISEPKKS